MVVFSFYCNSCYFALVISVPWKTHSTVFISDIYLDTETTRADARIVHLVHEVREVVTDAKHSPSTDAFQAGSIFTGQRGRPKLEVTQEQLQFLIESRLNTPQIASLLGVSQQMVERRLREWNLNII